MIGKLFKIISISLLLSGFSLFAEKLKYSMELDPDFVSVNRRFQVNIIVNREEHENLEISEPDYSGDLVKVAGPYISTVKEQEDTPEYKAKTRITYTYYPSRTGRIKIGPYKLDFNDDTIETKIMLLKSGHYKKGGLVVPLNFRWEYDDAKYYVGETIKLKLKSHEMEDIQFFYNVNIKNPGNGVFEQIQDTDDISSEVAGGVQLYTLPVVAYALTPSRSGSVNISPVTISAGGISGETDNLRLYINALPVKVSRTSGAIGEFNYKAELTSTEIEEGEKLNLVIRLEGEGNFNYLQMPDPVFENLVLLDKSSNDFFNENGRNYKGSIVYDYQFLASKEGPANIKTADFYYFNKDTEDIITLEGSQFDIKVSPPIMQKKEKNPLPESLKTLIPFEKILKMQDFRYYSNPFFYLIIVPGLIYFIVVLIKKNRASRLMFLSLMLLSCSSSTYKELKLEAENYGKALEHFINAEYEDSEKLIADISSRFPHNYGLLIDRAVLCYKKGDNAKAIALFRKAVLFNPMSLGLRKELFMFEKHLGLKNQISPGFIIDPDVFFIASLVIFNLCFIILALIIKHRDAKKFIAMVFALGLLAMAVFFSFYSAFRLNEKECVILNDTSIKRIPKEAASKWIEFKSGEVFRIIDESGDYYLIENAYKIRGWLEKESVLIIKDA